MDKGKLLDGATVGIFNRNRIMKSCSRSGVLEMRLPGIIPRIKKRTGWRMRKVSSTVVEWLNGE